MLKLTDVVLKARGMNTMTVACYRITIKDDEIGSTVYPTIQAGQPYEISPDLDLWDKSRHQDSLVQFYLRRTPVEPVHYTKRKLQICLNFTS
jgi:hypothetical protein